MGKVRTNIAFKGFSNIIDGLVYYERYGRTCVKAYVKPTDPRTPAQMKVRGALRGLAALWRQMDGIVKESWKSRGRKSRISGYFAFVAENAVKQRDGLAILLCAGHGMEGPERFTAKAGKAAGSIDCEYSAGEGAGDFRVYFFAQRTEKDLSGGNLGRFDGGAAGAFTVTGLEPGAEYHVHALLTDAAYDEATMVSESLSAVCRAKE